MSSDLSFDLGVRLISACGEGNLERVLRLLRFGANPSFAGPNGQTPLHAVVLAYGMPAQRRLALISALVRAGALVNLQNESGTTVLMLAAKDPAVRVALLDAGAHSNLQDKKGDTALIWSISVNRAPSVDHLIAAGADVSLPGQYGRTPLAWAAHRGNLSYVRSLLSAGAQIDCRDVKVTTPLMIALLMGHTELALALADAGADLRAVNQAGTSIIWCAAKANHSLILRRAKACGEKLGVAKEARLRLSGLLVKLLRNMLAPIMRNTNASK